MRNQLLTLLFLFLTTFGIGQIADYNFNTSIFDSANTYHATSYGNPSFVTEGSDQVIELEGDEYLHLPVGLESNIDVNSSFQFRVRFKVTDDYTVTTYNGQNSNEPFRYLVGNKETCRPCGGFELYIGDWAGEMKIIATYGDGLEGEFGGFSNEGQLDFIADFELNTWYDITVKMYLNAAPYPYIQYVVNNSPQISYFSSDHFDIPAFRETLDDQQIWVGSDVNNYAGMEYTPFMKTRLDYLTFDSPISPGNPAAINTVLTTLADEMNGTTILTTAQIDALFGDFILNWDDGSYVPNQAAILNYLNAYETNFGTVFSGSGDKVNPASMSVQRRIQFIMQQWMHDNLFAASNAANMAGIAFADRIHFPGDVATAAPRFTNAAFSIDGDYQTDPAFSLNGQETVIRPTGYYLPAGEIVTLTVPVAAVNQGWGVRVGAHLGNLESTWLDFNRFPRVSTYFPMDIVTMTLANPFGGAIYILVPDGAALGAVTFTVSGAVKAPYYSTKVGFETSLTDYQNELNNNYVPWVDWESAKFKATFPAAAASTVVDPNAVLDLWDSTFDAFNTVAGRPLDRFRGEYILIDKQNNYAGTAAPAAYPMPIEVGDSLFDLDADMVPIDVANGLDFITSNNGSTGLTHFIILHEMGHLHNMPTIWEEVECNVNLPAVAVYNMVYNQPLDTALTYSNQQRLNFDEAALDWILTPVFRKGIRMGLDTFQYEGYWDSRQQAYQTRGYAKYVDIANIFSWDTLGLVNQYFYDLGTTDPNFDAYGIEDDDYINAASQQLNINMAPLFEFWGIIPTQSLVTELSTRPLDNRIKDRILHYRSIVPTNNVEYIPIYDAITATIEEYPHRVRYDNMLTTYNESVADSITAQIDYILCKYYNENCEMTAVDVQLDQNCLQLLPNPTDGIFEIQGLLQQYNIQILDASGTIYQTLNNTGSDIQIDISTLPSGLYFIRILNTNNSSIYLEKILKM